MLVLSRKVDQKVVFPNLGISVQVLRIGNRSIRLGIDAPPEVVVMRDELEWRLPSNDRVRLRKTRIENSDELRSRVHAAAIELNDLHQIMKAAVVDDTEASIFRIFWELQAMDDELARQCGNEARNFLGTRKRALLVDDNINETHLLASYLRYRRFEVATTCNGSDAMDYLDNNEAPDFVLLDMLMPEYDGRWTIDQIRNTPCHAKLKVFGISGVDPDEFGVKVGPGGLDRWFNKPLNPESIVFQMFSDSFSESTIAP